MSNSTKIHEETGMSMSYVKKKNHSGGGVYKKKKKR
jgi:hypothetical protein